MRVRVDDYQFFAKYCGKLKAPSRAGSLPQGNAFQWGSEPAPGSVPTKASEQTPEIYFSNPLDGNTSVPRQRRTERWKNRLLGTWTMALPVPSSSASINVV